jgi:uncharacterized protein (TIGR02217 family)
MAFHETRFPTTIALGATAGPERRTEVITLGSGHEERNARWANSRRKYNAGYGVKTLDDLHEVINFFEERRGKLYGFRWKDMSDYKSCPPSMTPSATDQIIGTGDGEIASFQLQKTYGSDYAPWARTISKPVAGTIQVAVAGDAASEDEYNLDIKTGLITFAAEQIPPDGTTITAGFEFDVPVRFDTDQLEISLDNFNSGQIPQIPIVEIRP